MGPTFSVEEVVAATGGILRARGPLAGFHGVSTDTRALAPGSLFVALRGERFDGNQFVAAAAQAGAAGAVVSASSTPREWPSSLTVIEVVDTLHALGRLARFHRDRFQMPIAAVTGSNGKTTVKELVASILLQRGPVLKTQGNLNNEIGVPLTLFGLQSDHLAAVVEMGMNHLGEIARMVDIARPTAGLITTVQAAHLEGLGSIEGVASAKGELFAGLGPDAVAVVNVDDPHVVQQQQRTRARTLSFGTAPSAEVRLLSAKATLEGTACTIEWNGKRFAIALPLLGAHNAMNATAAFALAVSVGYQANECIRGLEAVSTVAGRLRVRRGKRDVLIIDDTYNANPGSMAAALKVLALAPVGAQTVAVFGDMLELGGHAADEHAKLIQQAAADAAWVALLGPQMLAARAAVGLGRDERVVHFDSPENAAAWAQARAGAGGVVLVKGSRGMKMERVVASMLGEAVVGGH